MSALSALQQLLAYAIMAHILLVTARAAVALGGGGGYELSLVGGGAGSNCPSATCEWIMLEIQTIVKGE